MPKKPHYRGGGGGWKTVGAKSAPDTSSSYSAPTAGLQKVLFSFGSTKDAAEFITTKSKLARFVGTQSWPGAPVASMAMEDMADPILTPPTRPTLEHVLSTCGYRAHERTHPVSSRLTLLASASKLKAPAQAPLQLKLLGKIN